MIADVPFEEHGHRQTYSYKGCRCILCTAANRAYMRDIRARRKTYDRETIGDWDRSSTLEWFNDAACFGHDTELWFAADGRNPNTKQAREAISICLQCPVIEQCLTYSLEMPTPWHGIYAGLTPRQRLAEYNRRHQRRPH